MREGPRPGRGRLMAKKLWPVRDAADAELYALLLRHPEVGAALVDLTRGDRMNCTSGAAPSASAVCDLVGMWRAGRRP